MSQNKKTEFILYDSVDDGNRMDRFVFYLFHLVFSLFILGLIKQIQSHKTPQK